MEEKELNENPSKENGFIKVLKMFGLYLKHLAYDFFTSFKYNNMKLAAILVAVPGVIFGFFLNFHANTITRLGYSYQIINTSTMSVVERNYPGMPYDFTGIVVFIMMLVGILNLFTAASMSGKKNLGSVVLATVLTSIFIICSVLYFYAIFYYKGILDKTYAVPIPGTQNFRYYVMLNGKEYPGINATWKWNTNTVMSLVSVIISVVCSVAGVVLGFIKYDRTYEKVDR